MFPFFLLLFPFMFSVSYIFFYNNNNITVPSGNIKKKYSSDNNFLQRLAFQRRLSVFLCTAEFFLLLSLSFFFESPVLKLSFYNYTIGNPFISFKSLSLCFDKCLSFTKTLIQRETHKNEQIRTILQAHTFS
jgi:hypothetical protein